MKRTFFPWVAFSLGAVVSIGANVLHAAESATGDLDAGRIVAAGWAPVALLLVAEMVTRSRQAGPWWVRAARFAGTAVVAGVAAVVSYTHMHDLLLTYGQDRGVALLLPLSVDGLVLVASVALAYPDDATGKGSVPEQAEGSVPRKAGSGGAGPETAPVAEAVGPPAEASRAAREAAVPGTAERAGTRVVGAEQHPLDAVHESVADPRQAAREAVRAALRSGAVPPSGTDLGERYGFGDRWGRKQVEAVRNEPEFAGLVER